jgi:hypothetical protein
MMTTREKLRELLEQVCQLPEERQAAAVEALSEIADTPHRLSDEELTILLPALEEAHAGRNPTDAETDPLLNAPWR